MHKGSCTLMSSLAAIAGLLGLNAYRISREPLWLWGSFTMLAILPWSLAALAPVSNSLEHDLQDAQRISTTSNSSVMDRLSSWLWKHRVTAVLAVAAVGLFYAAESKSGLFRYIPVEVVKVTNEVGQRLPGIRVPVGPAVWSSSSLCLSILIIWIFFFELYPRIVILDK